MLVKVIFGATYSHCFFRRVSGDRRYFLRFCLDVRHRFPFLFFLRLFFSRRLGIWDVENCVIPIAYLACISYEKIGGKTHLEPFGFVLDLSIRISLVGLRREGASIREEIVADRNRPVLVFRKQGVAERVSLRRRNWPFFFVLIILRRWRICRWPAPNGVGRIAANRRRRFLILGSFQSQTRRRRGRRGGRRCRR